MRIVLSKDVKGLGNAGEIKEVADGYARNYLLPRGLAVAATAAAVSQVEARRAADAKRQAREESSARTVADRLAAQPLVLHAKAGEQHRLYGSITSQDIADAIGRELGETFDKRKVELEEPIRALGTFTVPVRIARNVVASVNVEVQPEAGG
jgi:large subunit ribosomal protein L9